jgi:hypothetical protein
MRSGTLARIAPIQGAFYQPIRPQPVGLGFRMAAPSVLTKMAKPHLIRFSILRVSAPLRESCFQQTPTQFSEEPLFTGSETRTEDDSLDRDVGTRLGSHRLPSGFRVLRT